MAENISLQRSNYIIFGLTDIVALFGKEARFFRFRVIFQDCSLLNEVGDPPFFYISDISNSSTLSGKSLRKKSMLENFRANVLKLSKREMWYICTPACKSLDTFVPRFGVITSDLRIFRFRSAMCLRCVVSCFH